MLTPPPPPGQMAAISRTMFSRAFTWMNFFVFWLKFHWGFSWGSNLPYPGIALDDGLVPNRHQAIVWNNADPIH